MDGPQGSRRDLNAPSCSDRKAEGEYLGCLGNDLLAQREFEQASRYCKDALGIARERGDRENEAN
jgi:hypothetical protein